MTFSIHTERLVLSPIRQQDAAELYRIMSTYPDLSQFMTWDPPKDQQQIESQVETMIDSEDIYLGIYKENQCIGLATVRNLHWWQQDSNKSSGFLSFWLSPEKAGGGLGTEMLHAICTFCFETLTLRKVFAGAFSENIISQKVLAKVGFEHVGILSNHYVKHGKEIDSHRFELLPSTFLPRENFVFSVEGTPPTPPKMSVENREFLSEIIDPIETKIFSMRTLTLDDADEIMQLVQTHPDISTYMTWQAPQTKEEAIHRLIKMRRENDLNLGVFDLENKLIARVTLRNFRRKQQEATKNSAFFSYWVAQKDHDQILDIEIIKAVKDYCFNTLSLRKIMAGLFAKDLQTITVLEKTGFQKIGTLRNHYRKNETDFDSVRYEVINPKYT